MSSVKNIKVETDPERLRPINADLPVPDTTKFRNPAGWQPEIPFENTVEDLLNYWRCKVQKDRDFLVR